MTRAARLFDERLARDPAPVRWLRRAIVGFLCVHVVLATAAGYRAIVQVYRVELAPPAGPLGAGSRVEVAAVTSGRTTVTLRLELRQGAQRRPLGETLVRTARDAGYDPRPRHGRLAVTLAPDQLRGLAPGAATLRAVATGRSQWLRVPPPTVVERAVTLRPD